MLFFHQPHTIFSFLSLSHYIELRILSRKTLGQESARARATKNQSGEKNRKKEKYENISEWNEMDFQSSSLLCSRVTHWEMCVCRSLVPFFLPLFCKWMRVYKFGRAVYDIFAAALSIRNGTANAKMDGQLRVFHITLYIYMFIHISRSLHLSVCVCDLWLYEWEPKTKTSSPSATPCRSERKENNDACVFLLKAAANRSIDIGTCTGGPFWGMCGVLYKRFRFVESNSPILQWRLPLPQLKAVHTVKYLWVEIYDGPTGVFDLTFFLGAQKLFDDATTNTHLHAGYPIHIYTTHTISAVGVNVCIDNVGFSYAYVYIWSGRMPAMLCTKKCANSRHWSVSNRKWRRFFFLLLSVSTMFRICSDDSSKINTL